MSKLRSDTLTLEHIDPRNHSLICGFYGNALAMNNEIMADHSYNSRKTNRFVPYRVCDYSAPITFGDMGEFLIGEEWKICEFGGMEWMEESRKIGFSSTATNCGKEKGGKNRSRSIDIKRGQAFLEKQIGIFDPLKIESVMRGCRKGGETQGKNNVASGHLKSICTTEVQRRGANAQHSQRWMCLETKKISTPCGLTHWQKARGIDTKLRVKLQK